MKLPEVGVLLTSSLLRATLSSTVPLELFKPSGYEHQEALFGIPRYGGSITQRLIYLGDYSVPYQLCSDPADDESKNPNNNQPFILLVDRGGEDCTFVSKVRRAQHMGAAGVIIADDRCQCSDIDCVSESDKACESIEPIMADDGSGSDITVPSFLMTLPDSKVIKSYLQAKVLVQVEMAWSLPAPDDRIEWSLWSTTMDVGTYSLKADFKEVALALSRHAYFTPHYTLFDGELYGCTNVSNFCGSLCSNKGRYCSPDPDSDLNSGISGYDVTAEVLRQKCIWLYYGGTYAPEEDQGIGKAWWEYVKNFSAMCGVEQFNDSECISSAMAASGVNSSKIIKCMRDSGGLDSDVENPILSAELKEQASKSIVVTPTVLVNNAVERGGMTVAAVLTMLCSGFAPGTEPDVCMCSGQGSSASVKLCLEQGLPSNSSGGVSLATVLIIVLAAIVITSTAALYHYRKSQHAMREQVRGILAQYVPLEDMDEPNAGTRVPFMSKEPDDMEDEFEMTKSSTVL